MCTGWTALIFVALCLVSQSVAKPHTEDLDHSIDTQAQTAYFVVPALIAFLSSLLLLGLLGYHLAGEFQKSRAARESKNMDIEYGSIN